MLRKLATAASTDFDQGVRMVLYPFLGTWSWLALDASNIGGPPSIAGSRKGRESVLTDRIIHT